MADTKSEAPPRTRAARRTSRPVGAAWLHERRRIARALHDGVLQDLTVAGLKLRAIAGGRDETIRPALVELSGWLAERQADLRSLVAELGGTQAPATLDAMVEGVRSLAARQHACSLTVTQRPGSSDVDPMLLLPMRIVLESAVRLLAGEAAARQVSATIVLDRAPRLLLVHDGQPLRVDAERLAILRRVVGSQGASLRSGARDGRERLVIDWAA